MKTIDLVKLTNAATLAAEQVASLLSVSLNKVYIGGSLALVLQDVVNRDVHDIDIIVKTTSIKAHSAILAAHNALRGTVVPYNPSCEKYSYIVGIIHIEGMQYPINVILDNSSDYYIRERISKVQLQHPTMIKYAKMSYKPQRVKDIADINAIIEWENKQK